MIVDGSLMQNRGTTEICLLFKGYISTSIDSVIGYHIDDVPEDIIVHKLR